MPKLVEERVGLELECTKCGPGGREEEEQRQALNTSPLILR